jgi:secreted trypsin-like serine protease
MSLKLRRQLVTLAVAAAALLAAAPAAPASGTTTIVGGSTAPAGKYPYAVHLDGTLYSCGGSLIAPEWVLTAGHCIVLYSPAGAPAVPAAHITATAGRENLNDTSKGQESIGLAAFVHPLYNSTTNPSYDVALIRLASPISGYPTIKIAGPGEEPTWKAGTQSTIIGWGLTSDGGDPSDTLREAQVPIVSDADCSAAYALVGIGDTTVSQFDPATMLCAGYLGRGGVDTCQGDSGGPLLVPIAQGGYRQAGITSWGAGCAEKDYPGVYSRIGAAALRDFVALHVPDAIGTGATPAGSGGGKQTKKPRKTTRRKSAKRKRSHTRRATRSR